MNPSLGAFWMKQLAPLTDAARDATERVQDGTTPLQRHTKYGMEPIPDLRRAIGLLTIPPIETAAHHFLEACEAADKEWRLSRDAMMKKHGPDGVDGDMIKNAFRKGSGQYVISGVEKAYVDLMNEIQRILREA
jgi:hypothetical protein